MIYLKLTVQNRLLGKSEFGIPTLIHISEKLFHCKVPHQISLRWRNVWGVSGHRVAVPWATMVHRSGRPSCAGYTDNNK